MRSKATLMITWPHRVWGQTPPKKGGYVMARRLNAASVADINQRRHLSKQAKKALEWPHTPWIKPLSSCR